MSDEKQILWLDLGVEDVRVAPRRLSSGAMVLVLLGNVDPEDAQALRFSRTPGGLWFSAAYTHADGTLKELPVKAFRARFPEARARRMPISEAMAQTPAAESAGRDLIRDYEELAPNPDGNMVCRDAQGRFIRVDGQYRRPKESATFDPEFLLGGTSMIQRRDAWPEMVRGFVASRMEGPPITRQDLERLYRIIVDKPADEEFRMADIEGLRRIREATILAAGKILGEIRREKTLDADAFLRLAARVDTNLPASDNSGASNVGRGFTPFLGAAVARAIGDDAQGRAVLPYAGNGMLLNFLPETVQPEVLLHSLTDNSVWSDTLQSWYPDAQIRKTLVTDEQDAHDTVDVLAMSAPRSEITREVDGVLMSGPGHAEAAAKLTALKHRGRAVILLPGRAADDPRGRSEVERWLSWAARHYRVERVLELGPTLFGEDHMADVSYLVEIGGRRWLPDPEAAIPSIQSCATRDEVIAALGAQQRAQEKVQAGPLSKYLQTFVSNAERSGIDELNDYQRPYVPLSRGDCAAAVPKNLQSATYHALHDLARTHGLPEDILAQALEMDRDELEKCAVLSPEQKDALALIIPRIRDKGAFLLADNTGVGKGRTLVGAALAGINEGRKVIFVTKNAALFSNFWQDVKDMGLEQKVRPFPATAIDIMDRDGKVAFPADPDAVNTWNDSGKIPGDRNVLLITYAAIGKTVGYNPKSRKKQKMSEQKMALNLKMYAEDALILFDESHLATGTGAYHRGASILAEKAGALVFSSATPMRDPRGILLYKRLLPASLARETTSLPGMMRRGGAAMQGILTEALVRNGAAIRRELDLRGVEIRQSIDPGMRARNEQIINAQAQFFQRIEDLGEVIDRALADRGFLVTLAQSAMGSRAKFVNLKSAIQSLDLTRMGFADYLHLVMVQTNLALNQESVARAAVRDLREGRKPVIVFAQTGNVLHEDLLPKIRRNSEADLLGAPPTADRYPDIKDVLRRLARRQLEVEIRDPQKPVKGERRATYKVHLLDDLPDSHQKKRIEQAYAKLLEEVEKVPDLPYAPMDYVREAIESQGFRVAEISGRGYQVQRIGQGVALVSRPERDKNTLIHKFNHGDVDALIGTGAISTGASLHAAPTFRDQRPRTLILGQQFQNVAEFVQVFGRVCRYGQVRDARVEVVGTGTPAEQRIMAMVNANLKQMSATVSSNQDSAYRLTAPDLFNRYGDEACLRVLTSNDTYRKWMRVTDQQMDHWINASRNGATARAITGRVMMLAVEQQKEILGKIDEAYKHLIDEELGDEAEALLAGELPLNAVVVQRQNYKTPKGVRSHYDNVFDKPVELLTLEYVAPPPSGDPMNLLRQIRNNETEMRSRGLIDENGVGLPRHRAAFEKHYEARKQELMERYNASKQKGGFGEMLYEMHLRDLDTIKNLLPTLRPGVVYGDNPGTARLILDVKPAPLGAELQPEEYRITYTSMHSGINTIAVTRISLDADHVSRFDLDHPLYEMMKNANNGVPQTRYALAGNLLEAARISMEIKTGQPAVVVMKNGERLPSVILPSSFNLRVLYNHNQVLNDPDEVLDFLGDHRKTPLMDTLTYDPDKSLRIGIAKGYLNIEAPKGDDLLKHIAQSYNLSIEPSTRLRDRVGVPINRRDVVRKMVKTFVHYAGELRPHSKKKIELHNWKAVRKRKLAEKERERERARLAAEAGAGPSP